jgi:hypothetical protein
MLTENMKCLDGPLEGELIEINRRRLVMYDELTIPEMESIFTGKREVERKRPTGRNFLYMITANGLSFIKEVENEQKCESP